jgi:hypothetical protein
MALRIVIEYDSEYLNNPAAFVDWDEQSTREYVERFERGELTAYTVAVEDVAGCPCGRDNRYLASLAGVDVDTLNADGVYDSVEAVPEGYLREVAAELWAEATGLLTAA